MIIIKQKNNPLSTIEITEQLLKLRNHCYSPKSNFTVSAILEVETPNNIIYIGGVNVEDKQHNRLGLHAEQNALATMVMLLGPTASFSKAWLMGALRAIKQGINDPLADNHVTPCGHCRQLLIGFANENAEVISISLNGKVKKLGSLPRLLPDLFSEKDLKISHPNIPASEAFEVAQEDDLCALLTQDISTENQDQILKYLTQIKPYVIEGQFKTSPIDAVILKLSNGVLVPGTLVQNIAFISTDAIYAAIGHAVTRFGHDNVVIDALYLLLNDRYDDNKPILSGCETQCITEMSQGKNIPIYCYNRNGFIGEVGFRQYF